MATRSLCCLFSWAAVIIALAPEEGWLPVQRTLIDMVSISTQVPPAGVLASEPGRASEAPESKEGAFRDMSHTHRPAPATRQLHPSPVVRLDLRLVEHVRCRGHKVCLLSKDHFKDKTF